MSSTDHTDAGPQVPFGNLLDERLLHYRRTDSGARVAATLPELFVAMARDEVRDFPALRPHQRHPWHAFLVQLAAIALNCAGRTDPFATVAEWREALLGLTPDDTDGAAWCLVSPLGKPGFMQAPEPTGSIEDWQPVATADELDMLITSKNHDLKASRIKHGNPEDWVFALVSLQTQDGYPGRSNFGIARMNSGSGSRCGVGLSPAGHWGRRWLRDISSLQAARSSVVETYEYSAIGGVCLVWLVPWTGRDSIQFQRLDPWFIEICRRVRFTNLGSLTALTKGSEVRRIGVDKELKGRTGDPWMPIDLTENKALTITEGGFGYKLVCELMFDSKYQKPAAQAWSSGDADMRFSWIARGVARGQSKTGGFHERVVPISRKVQRALMLRETDELARIATDRVAAVAEVKEMLRSALRVLFSNTSPADGSKGNEFNDTVKGRATQFAQPFEELCDSHFFAEFNEEVESDDRSAARMRWLLDLADRAEGVLRTAFVAGPRNGQLRYRAQAAALTRLNAAMRGNKLPALAQALKHKHQTQVNSTEEAPHEHA